MYWSWTLIDYMKFMYNIPQRQATAKGSGNVPEEDHYRGAPCACQSLIQYTHTYLCTACVAVDEHTHTALSLRGRNRKK